MGSITLFVAMQMTGRTSWENTLVGAKAPAEA
jgi:hypothetical protein